MTTVHASSSTIEKQLKHQYEKISGAKSYKSMKIIEAKLMFYRRRQNEQNKVGAESRRLTMSVGNMDRK